MSAAKRFWVYSEKPTGAHPGANEPGLGYHLGAGEWSTLADARAFCVDLLRDGSWRSRCGRLRILDRQTREVIEVELPVSP